MNPSEVISHIEPKKKWLDVDIKGLWHYRDLYVMYIKRDIITYYKQTIFGPIWYVVQPILTTIMYVFVFGKMAGIPTDNIPRPLFYLAGITMWNYFSQCFTMCSDVFGGNVGVFGKVYFPRLVVPLSATTSSMFRMLIQFAVFIIIYVYYSFTGQFHFCLSWYALLFPILSIIIGLQAMAIGILISSWTVKYRDLKFVIQFGVQLLMYATPVIYPLSFMPEQYRWIITLNPLTSVFELFRYSFLGEGSFTLGGVLYSIVFLVISVFFSVIIFNRTEQKFMDVV